MLRTWKGHQRNMWKWSWNSKAKYRELNSSYRKNELKNYLRKLKGNTNVDSEVVKYLYCMKYKILLDFKIDDFKQSYDNIWRDKLYYALHQLKILVKLIKFITMALENLENKVRINRKLRRAFLSLILADPLSAILFNSEYTMHKANIHRNGTFFNMTFLTRTRKEIQYVTKRLLASAQNMEIWKLRKPRCWGSRWMQANSTNLKR